MLILVKHMHYAYDMFVFSLEAALHFLQFFCFKTKPPFPGHPVRVAFPRVFAGRWQTSFFDRKLDHLRSAPVRPPLLFWSIPEMRRPRHRSAYGPMLCATIEFD